MRPTIKDVARQANVSVATVSRIVNNLPGCTERTKKTVLRAIDHLGYQPNAVARGLVSGTTASIGVLVPVVSSVSHSTVLRGICHAAEEYEHSVVICDTQENVKSALEYVKILKSRQIDGIVCVGQLMDRRLEDALLAADLPVVQVSSRSENDFPFVKIDDRMAAFEATRYLIDNGHRHIGMIGDTPELFGNETPRLSGYLQALEQSGIPCREEYITYGKSSYTSGLRAAEKLLNQAPGLTAIFAVSDEMALAAMTVAGRKGLRVPDDLSVMGCDNTLLAEASVPPLTTVSQPLYRMGFLGGEMLFQMIRKERKPSGRVIEHVIVERDTVRKL